MFVDTGCLGTGNPRSSFSSRQAVSPSSVQQAIPQPSGWMGGLMGGVMGCALGRLLGSLLFGSLWGGLLGGLGRLEILLIGWSAVLGISGRLMRMLTLFRSHGSDGEPCIANSAPVSPERQCIMLQLVLEWGCASTSRLMVSCRCGICKFCVRSATVPTNG